LADRYLLESGAPDGYQLEDGSGVLLLEGGATPEGWQSSVSRAVTLFGRSLAFGVTATLVLTPLPPPLPSAPEGWQAVQAKARPPTSDVRLDIRPFGVPEPPAAFVEGWRPVLAKAPPTPLPAPRIWSFVPFDTAQVVAAPFVEGWQGVTARAPHQVPRPPVAYATLPYVAEQVVIAFVEGWQPTKAVAPPLTTRLPIAAVNYVLLPPAAFVEGWQPVRAIAPHGVSRPTVLVNYVLPPHAAFVDGWQGQTVRVPLQALARPIATASFVYFQAVTVEGWQPTTARAAMKLPPASVTWSFVPFVPAQVVPPGRKPLLITYSDRPPSYWKGRAN